MGGGHHHEPFNIPKYTIYNDYQKFPELLAHEKRLAQLGLKDPWIRFDSFQLLCTRHFRNYVYLYDRQYPHVVGQWAHFKKVCGILLLLFQLFYATSFRSIAHK